MMLKNREKKKQSGNKKEENHRPLILIILAVFILFIIIVMAINSVKPDPLEVTNADRKVKGATFTRVNQALINQETQN